MMKKTRYMCYIFCFVVLSYGKVVYLQKETEMWSIQLKFLMSPCFFGTTASQRSVMARLKTVRNNYGICVFWHFTCSCTQFKAEKQKTTFQSFIHQCFWNLSDGIPISKCSSFVKFGSKSFKTLRDMALNRLISERQTALKTKFLQMNADEVNLLFS